MTLFDQPVELWMLFGCSALAYLAGMLHGKSQEREQRIKERNRDLGF